MKTFEKLYMREDAKDLYIYVHKLFTEKKNKDTRFQDEFFRVILLIGGTIAQGHEINLANVNPYLEEAKGFAGACKNIAYIAKDLGYFNEEERDYVLGKCSKIAAGLYKYMTSKKKKPA